MPANPAAPRRLRRVARTIALTFLGVALWAASPEAAEAQAPAAEVRSPGAEWNRVRQEVLPALSARAQAATALREAWEGYFAGEIPLRDASPLLADAPLGSPAWIAGRLNQLDDAETARLEERLAPIPELGSAKRADLLQRALGDALTAEAAADALERRLLLALRKQLSQHPELTDRSLAPVYQRLREVARAADAAFEAADPETRDALAQAATRAQADLDRLEALRAALRRLATIPGTLPPDPAEDIALLADPATAPAALERLALMEPTLGAEAQAQARDAQIAWIQGTQLTAIQAEQEAADAALAAAQAAEAEPTSVEHRPIGELEAEAAAAQGAAQVARAAVDALPEVPPGSVASARQALIRARLKVAETRLAAAQSRLSAARAHQSAASAETSAEADRSKLQAQAAREAAEKAAQEADGARQRWFANLLESVATEQEKANDLWSAAEALRKDTEARLAELRQQLGDLQRRAPIALELGPLDPRRQPELDGIFEQSRQVMTALRRLATELGGTQVQSQVQADGPGALQAAAADAPRELPTDLTEDERAALDAVRAAREDQQRALDATSAMAREKRDDALHALADAKELRRQITDEVSSEVLEDERAFLIDDFIQEIRFVAPNVLSLIDGRLRALSDLPKLLFNIDVVWAFLIGSLRLLVVLSAWLWLRRRSVRLGRWLLHLVWRRQDSFVGQSLTTLEEPTARALQAAIDLAAGWALVGPVAKRVPELGLLLLIYLQVALYRLLVGLFDLLVARHPEVRPALVTLQADPHRLLRRTVKALFFWVIARQFTLYITLTILGADRISAVAEALFSMILVALLLSILHGWEPPLRGAVSRLDQSNRLIHLLSQPPQSTLLRAPRALASALLIATLFTINVFRGRLDERSTLGRLVNAVNRYRMATPTGEVIEALPEPPKGLVAQIRASVCPTRCYVERPAVDQQIDAAAAAYQDEGRRGLIALTGDQGDGKRTYLDNLVQRYRAQGRTVGRARMSRRLTTEAAMLAWLAEVTGLPPAQRTPAELSVALADLPPQVWILEEVHMAFLRSVDGFDGLRALLYVLNGASREHFWIVSFHLPAWHYLRRLGQLVNMQVFRAAVRLAPMGEQQLRTLLLSRTAEAGYQADFTPLVRRSPLGADPVAELERTISAFFRLLGEASAGNPEVALRMWAGCLGATDDPGVVRVRMGDALTEAPVGSLSDLDLFTLTALRIQNHLTEDELVEVTNMAPATLRSVIRDLESRNLLTKSDGLVALEDAWIPAITRLLKRRHFIQSQ